MDSPLSEVPFFLKFIHSLEQEFGIKGIVQRRRKEEGRDGDARRKRSGPSYMNHHDLSGLIERE